MTADSATAEAEALDWIIRVQHSEFADWDALSVWLAADPRHAEIFQQLALLDDEIATDLAGREQAVGDGVEIGRQRRR